MGKKKPFINKKNASTYSLLHRSQRDVADDVMASTTSSNAAISNGMVLWPSPSNNPQTDQVVLGENSVMQEWRQKLAEVGLLDSQDSEMYMKEITGSGTFLGRTGHVEDPLADPRAMVRLEEETLVEVNRQIDSIPLTTEIMDDDIAAALFGDDVEEYEELNDDFVLMAAAEPDDKEEEFDYDRHIQQLMEKARLEREGGPITQDHRWGNRDNEFFSRLQPLHELDDEDGSLFNTPGVVSKLTPEEERALCEKFEMTLAEYDSDEIGDCEVDDDDDENPRMQADDAQLDGVMDDFLLDKEDDILIYGRDTSRAGGSAFHHINHDDGPPETIHEILAEAKDVLAEPLQAPPPEDVLIDGKSYFSLKERNPWDCESILTTYSNLDNNPVVIGVSRSRRRKTKNPHPTNEEVPKILLSNKTGLPLGVLPGRTKLTEKDNETFRSVNRGEARAKTETAEEKKARKALIKQERQLARIQKKVTRQVFSEEFEKRVPTAADDLACKTVFRF